MYKGFKNRCERMGLRMRVNIRVRYEYKGMGLKGIMDIWVKMGTRE